MPEEVQFEGVAVAIAESFSFKKPAFIGAGQYKEAYSTETPTGLPIALKIFDPNKCNLCRAEREIASMSQCTSPYIGKLYQWGAFEHNDGVTYFYTIEEYLSGGNLTNRLPDISNSLNHIRSYGKALIEAVSHLREKSLVHRDIKPDNIMFRSNEDIPILVDFGLVRDLTGTSLTQSFLQQGPGTPFFASPEQLNNDKQLIDWRSDQFSVGIVLSICLTGRHPYQDPGQTALDAVHQVISRANCSDLFVDEVNEMGCGFLAKMISPWPIERFAYPGLIIKELDNLKEGDSK